MRRWVVVLLTVLGWSPLAFAARVALEVPSGKLIEYQSDATAGTLLKNALSSGYTADQVEERVVTEAEWQALRKQWVEDVASAQQSADKVKHKGNADKVKAKLGLSDADFAALKDALQ